jgi:hypothetical protein
LVETCRKEDFAGVSVRSFSDGTLSCSDGSRRHKMEMKTLDRAGFDSLSDPMQGLVLAALTAPLFAVFAIVGDLPRGALAWTLSGALLIALNAHRGTTSLRKLVPPAAVLLGLHLPLVIWNPLQHAPFFGGIVTPVAVVDCCIDYAFLWVVVRIFKLGDVGEP